MIEHLTLQGFPPELARSMRQCDVVRGAGNACSVPVMGAVLGSLLQACPQLVHSHSDPSVHGGQLSEGRFRKRKRVAELRADIAMFQAQCKLMGR